MNEQQAYQEGLQNVLEKYGRDITAAAKDGKVDRLSVVMMRFVVLPVFYHVRLKTIRF